MQAMAERGEVSVGRVITRALGAIGAAPVTYLGTSAVLAAVPPALFGWTRPFTLLRPVADRHPFALVLPVAAVVLLGWIALRVLAQATLFRATVTRIGGRVEPFPASLAGATATVLPLVAQTVVLTLAVMAGFALLIVPGLMLATMWAVAAPVLAIERRGVYAALSRSRALTRGHRWRVFGLMLLGYGAYALAGLALHGVVASAPARSMLSVGGTVALTTAFVAISAAVQAALYVELREARDGPATDRLSAIFA